MQAERKKSNNDFLSQGSEDELSKENDEFCEESDWDSGSDSVP
jgi:hypothetical protein